MAAGIPSLKTSGAGGRQRAEPWLTRRAVQAAAAASSTSSTRPAVAREAQVVGQQQAGLAEQGPALGGPGPGGLA